MWTLLNDGHHRRYARKHARASLDILLACPRAVPLYPVWTGGKKEEKRAALCVYSPRDAGLSRICKQEKERKKENERGRERERGRKSTLPRKIRARSFLRAYAPYICVRVRDNLLVNVVIILKYCCCCLVVELAAASHFPPRLPPSDPLQFTARYHILPLSYPHFPH